MLRIPKKVAEPAIKQEAENPKATKDQADHSAVAQLMAAQSQALNDTVAAAAVMLAQAIAKNKPADGYLFTIQRDERGNITSLAAKRGRNAN
jgi:hypothetical protein